MKITKKQFLKDVRHEIDMLKEHATDVEKSRLDGYWFDPSDMEQCIYGQMTGSCESKRANYLMKVSCVRIFDRQSSWAEGADFATVKKTLNGVFKDEMCKTPLRRDFQLVSALEGYIMLKNAKIQDIISYIKGQTDTLTL